MTARQRVTDASLEGLGAVLDQKQADGHIHPIYASRSLHVHKQNYSITELNIGFNLGREVLYILLGHHTTVLTDHSAYISLQMFLDPRLCWLGGQ